MVKVQKYGMDVIFTTYKQTFCLDKCSELDHFLLKLLYGQIKGPYDKKAKQEESRVKFPKGRL